MMSKSIRAPGIRHQPDALFCTTLPPRLQHLHHAQCLGSLSAQPKASSRLVHSFRFDYPRDSPPAIRQRCQRFNHLKFPAVSSVFAASIGRVHSLKETHNLPPLINTHSFIVIPHKPAGDFWRPCEAAGRNLLLYLWSGDISYRSECRHGRPQAVGEMVRNELNHLTYRVPFHS